MLNKLDWLRHRPLVDRDVMEALDTVGETIVRLDAQVRNLESQLDEIQKVGKWKRRGSV
jgi:hypothetical protein